MLGAGRTHQQNFPLFLAIVIGLSVLTVAVFVLTAASGERASDAGRERS